MKYVTIASDVSCSPRHKISVWACYIRHSGGVIQHVEEFKDYQSCTSKAETYALINALTIARKYVPDWENSKVVIYNEIEYALEPIRSKAGNIRQRDQERAGAIINLALPILDEAGGWEIRKVKAHYKEWKTSSTPARYIMNRWCDRKSHEKMKYLRRKKKV